MCQIYTYTPTRQMGLCLFPKSSFDTSKLQQRKRTADKPSRGEQGVTVPWWSWSLLPQTLQLLVTLTAGNCFQRVQISDQMTVLHIPNCALICLVSTMTSAPWGQDPTFYLVNDSHTSRRAEYPVLPAT